MKRQIVVQAFPQQKYELIEHISENKKCSVVKYKNLEDQIDYLFHEYCFESFPDKIKRRIVGQIQEYGQYGQKQDFVVVDSVFLFQSEQGFRMSLRSKDKKSKTLSQLIDANQYISCQEEIAQQMINICLLIKRMHQNNHAHGALQLSNIYCSNERLTIGKPKYSQIEKWANAQISIDDQAAQQSVSEAEDVWSIGFVFLQMALNKVIVGNVNKQTVCKEYLPRVANPNFRHVLSVMLRRGGESVGILGVMGMLSNITNKDQFVFGPIPKQEECTSLRFTAFKDQPYRPAKALNIVKSIKREVKGCEMNFIFGNNSVMCIVTGKVIDFVIDFAEELQRYVKKIDWLNLKCFNHILEDQNNEITFSQQGFIQIRVNNKRIKQLKQKNREKISVNNFNNVCYIKGEKQRRGLIITQRIVITPTSDIQQMKRNEGRLTFKCEQLNRCTSQEYECFFVEEELQSSKRSKGAQLQYCAIDFAQTITLAYFGNYLKLIKNYDEAVIEGKVDEAEDADVYFNYQLGPRLLTKGDIVFKKDAFILANADGLLSGEPLRLNLSYNSQVSCAVIGLYVEKGAGILFNDQFYRSIYAIIGKIRIESEIPFTYHPFVFIDCKNFDFGQGQLYCLHNKSLQNYIRKNGLNRQITQKKIQKCLKDQQKHLQQLGFCHYLMYKNFSDGNPKAEFANLQKSDQYFSKYYKRGNITTVMIKIKLIQRMIKFNKNKSNIGGTDEKDRLKQFEKCAATLTQYHHNPILLRQLYRLRYNCSQEQQIQEILQKQQKLFIEFQLHKSLAQLYSRSIGHYQSLQNSKGKVEQIQKLLQKVNQKRFYLEFPFNDLDRKSRRVQKYIRESRFELVNDIMEEVFARHQSQVPLNKDKQKKLIQLWKATVMPFIQCKNIQELLQFQRITKRYYEEGYVLVRDHFRKRQKMLRSSLKQEN